MTPLGVRALAVMVRSMSSCRGLRRMIRFSFETMISVGDRGSEYCGWAFRFFFIWDSMGSEVWAGRDYFRIWGVC